MGVDLENTFTPGAGTGDRSGLIFVGRLVEKKGVGYLIEAIVRLVATDPDLMLTIVGDGPDRSKLQGLVHTYRLTRNIDFAGRVPNVELPRRLRAAQIAVMPSVVAKSGDQEGLGLVTIEALGCGCAVVASNLPAVQDTILDGETGLMAIPADSADLAEKISRLLADGELRQTLAEHGRDYALRKFDWKVVGNDYARLMVDVSN